MKTISKKQIDRLRELLNDVTTQFDDKRFISFISRIIYQPLFLGLAIGFFFGVLMCGLVMGAK